MIQYQKEYVVGVGYETINGAPQAEYPNIGAGGLINPGGSVELKCFGKVFHQEKVSKFDLGLSP